MSEFLQQKRAAAARLLNPPATGWSHDMLAIDAQVIAQAYLSEHAEDDDVEVTAEWLRGICHREFDTDGAVFEFHLPRGGSVLLIDSHGVPAVSHETRGAFHSEIDTVVLSPLDTRGDVRRLLSALQVKVRT